MKILKQILTRISFIIFCYLMTFFSAVANDASNVKKGKIPRFALTKVNEVNLRNGPNIKYPIKWTFIKAKEPIEIISEFEKWKKVRDIDGDEGWIHDSLISNKRRGIIKKGIEARLYLKNQLHSRTVAIIKPLVRIDISNCDLEWCYIKATKYKGWIIKKNIWGVYDNETF